MGGDNDNARHYYLGMNRAIVGVGMLLLATFAARADVEFLWGVTGAAGAASSLYAINPANGQVLGMIGATGKVCLSGLAIQPGTKTLFASQGQLSPTGASPKAFFQIDKATGVATQVGAALANTMPISDLAIRSDGTLFGFGIGGTVKKLLTINTSTAAVTTIGNTNNITNVSLTFGNDGTLYLVRTNGLFTVNPATGVMSALVAALSGATTQFDNFMATNAAGAVFGGLRTGGGTTIYRLNTTTGVTTLAATVAGVALDGMAFDTAAPPTFAVNGKKKIKTTKSSLTIKGTATSVLPLTVSAKGKSSIVAAGSWSLKVKLKKGKNKLTLVCADGMGQSVVTTVTVTRN